MTLKTHCNWCSAELLASRPIFIAYEPFFGTNAKIQLCDRCADVRAVMLGVARMLATGQATTPEEALRKTREAAGGPPAREGIQPL